MIKGLWATLMSVSLLGVGTACSEDSSSTNVSASGGAGSVGLSGGTGGKGSTSGGRPSSAGASESGGSAVASAGGWSGISVGGLAGTAQGGSAGTSVGGTSAIPSTGGAATALAKKPFPQTDKGTYCTYPSNAKSEDVPAAYQDWKNAVVTADGAGGFLRIKKPDSGSVIGSTVSEGIGYGMLLAVYMGDQPLFDGLWKYEQIHLDAQGLMDWEIGPDGEVTPGGHGAATDGDEDMAWALIMADRQWGGKGTLSDTYLNHAKALIDLMWTFEVDHDRNDMLKAGDNWGSQDITNPSYFAPAYYKVFGQVTGKTAEWNKVVDSSYDIINKSLSVANGNASNGLVPAWCDSAGTPTPGFAGAPTNFQNDSTRTPFRVGQDYCYFGEPRAKAYLARISDFYTGIGAANIASGYDLDGTPHPDSAHPGVQAASFVGPGAVGAMSDAKYQTFVNDAYGLVATLKLSGGTIYYQKSWTALSLLMLTGNFSNFAIQ